MRIVDLFERRPHSGVAQVWVRCGLPAFKLLGPTLHTMSRMNNVDEQWRMGSLTGRLLGRTSRQTGLAEQQRFAIATACVHGPHLERRQDAPAADGAGITACPLRGQAREQNGRRVGQIVAWVCLIVVIALAVGLALQIAAENTVSRADWSELTEPKDIAYTPGICSALDRHVNRSMTIDELRDLQDQLCSDLSEPRQTGDR